MTAYSEEVEVSINIIKALLTKAQILKLSGVPGKGIDTAPGLQKPFNPNSQASEHAGKKDKEDKPGNNGNQETAGNTIQNQEQEQNQQQNMEQEMNQGQNPEPENNQGQEQEEEYNNNSNKNKDKHNDKIRGKSGK